MVETTTNPTARSRRRLWALALLLAVAAFVAVFTPAFLIMPFKTQTPGKLELSYALRRVSPIAVPLAAVVLLGLSAYLWRGARWWSRSFLVLLCSLTLLFAWFARQNHFEWMFRPLPGPGFVRAESADFVVDDDMVLAVAVNGEAVAYPIRQIAYHHVVEDTVGGVPLVVTY
jgi:hypothetical protein